MSRGRRFMRLRVNPLCENCGRMPEIPKYTILTVLKIKGKSKAYRRMYLCFKCRKKLLAEFNRIRMENINNRKHN